MTTRTVSSRNSANTRRRRTEPSPHPGNTNLDENPASAPERKKRLLTFDELLVWQQDNPYILYVYRPETLSVKTCFHSWFYFHNETFNIYSHLLPCILFCLVQYWAYTLLQTRYPETVNIKDHIVVAWFLLAAATTFWLSAVYHTLMNHSVQLSSFCLRFDYAGILCTILGSFVSGIYVGFYCEPRLQWLYWGMICTFGTIAAVLVLHPSYQSMEYRTFRLLAFVLTSLSGIFPVIHGIVLHGLEKAWSSGVPYWILEGVIFLTGAYLYGSHWPERQWPGVFDYVGSHGIFHVLVVIAVAIHGMGVWTVLEKHLREGSCRVQF